MRAVCESAQRLGPTPGPRGHVGHLSVGKLTNIPLFDCEKRPAPDESGANVRALRLAR